MMGPIAAVESVVFKSFQIRGRATRAEYWWWALVQTTLLFACIWLDITRYFSDLDAAPPPLNPLKYTTLVFMLMTVPANLTVMVRRLHDTGRSGFWYFITLVPIIGGLWFLVLMLLPSQRDDNNYGPPWNDPSNWTGKSSGKENPLQAYAILARMHREPDKATLAARKEEISSYYRNNVLRSSNG